MLYLIRLRSNFPPKVVRANSLETIRECYRNWKVYTYKESGNPVTVEDSDHGYWRIRREVIPNMTYNQYCIWN